MLSVGCLFHVFGERCFRLAAVGFSDWTVSSQKPGAALRGAELRPRVRVRALGPRLRCRRCPPRWLRLPPASLGPAPPLLQPGRGCPVSVPVVLLVPECHVVPCSMAALCAVIGVRLFHLTTRVTESPPSSHSLHSGREHWMFLLTLSTFTVLFYGGYLRTVKKNR